MAGSWDIRRIYLYLVSFATLMMMIVGTVQFLQGVVNIAYPNPEPGPGYADVKMRYSDAAKNNPQITEAEINKQIAEEQAQAAKSQRYYEIRSMIGSLMMFLVALPVYLYHWRKIQKSETTL